MTETAQQYTLFGTVAPPQDLKLRDQVAYVMEHHPETRKSNKLLVAHYWIEFDGLDEVLDETNLARFVAWLDSTSTTDPETIRRRQQELHEKGLLLPEEPVQKYRQARSKAGPPRR